jgi:hypothetical protein
MFCFFRISNGDANPILAFEAFFVMDQLYNSLYVLPFLYTHIFLGKSVFKIR